MEDEGALGDEKECTKEEEEEVQREVESPSLVSEEKKQAVGMTTSHDSKKSITSLI